MNKTTPSLFGKMGKAATAAFDKAAQVGGSASDPDLRLYETLNNNDFDSILKQFGADDTIEYIRRMEARKLITGGKNG